MPAKDIFLSYASEDRDRIGPLIHALEGTGWTVFWDPDTPVGATWRDYIESELHEAGAIVVAWSAASVTSRWVLEEAELGKSREVLLPVLMEQVEPPFGFRATQALDLCGWSGDPDDPAFGSLVEGHCQVEPMAGRVRRWTTALPATAATGSHARSSATPSGSTTGSA